MAGNTNAKARKFGGSFRNSTESNRDLHEEEGREQDLLRRNEFGYSMGGHDSSGTNGYSFSEDHAIGAIPELQSVAPGVGVEPGTQYGKVPPERSNNSAPNIRRFFSKKSDRRQEEGQPWEQVGDEDLIGKTKGKFGTKRLFWRGSLDSQGCPTASPVEVKDIFRHIILNLGAYGEDLNGLSKAIKEHDPLFDPKGVVDFQKPTAHGACPPYFIYVDHALKEVSMYIRGLNLMHRQDYISLLNNRRGEKSFDGGYVHHGMSEPAEWAVKHAGPVLRDQLRANEGYRLTIVGHSLGAGVASLLTIFLIKKNTEVLGGINPNLIRAIVIAPPRVMSLDLAIKYADRVNSVIYQDDFLPRVSTQSVKRLFLTTFALTGAIVFIFWVKQFLQNKVSEDTKRLFPPGKIYHFVYKQPGKSGHRPIRARVVPSAKNRFERLVLSASGTINNHYILALAKHLKTYNWPEVLKDQWLTAVLQTA
ncbi:hypothetical protein KC19_3G013800 [Ceratodon purpureus]|uniref:Fungal lipase-type domain-containing protein n=1 Tax=Ceratodon purpureus TaxID=3225 RepID=A0A8T0IH30_CERPU|nr:hypothetical protein KC19_3G013800 [Ceratodon purpureus]